jgi:hypothetical protein
MSNVIEVVIATELITDDVFIDSLRRTSSAILPHVHLFDVPGHRTDGHPRVLLHGVDDSLLLSAEEFETWWRDYDLGGVVRVVNTAEGNPRARAMGATAIVTACGPAELDHIEVPTL